MKLPINAVIARLEEGLSLADSDLPAFAKRLTTKHELHVSEGVLCSAFQLTYTCPATGIMTRHTDKFEWQNLEEINRLGTEASELGSYANSRYFNDHMLINVGGDWLSHFDADLLLRLEEIGSIYIDEINPEELLPNWKQEVVDKVRSDPDLIKLSQGLIQHNVWFTPESLSLIKSFQARFSTKEFEMTFDDAANELIKRSQK